MRFTYFLFILCCLVITGCQSLRVERRLYTDGYYVSLNKKNQPGHTDLPSGRTKDTLTELASVGNVILEIPSAEKQILVNSYRSPVIVSPSKTTGLKKSSGAHQFTESKNLSRPERFNPRKAKSDEIPEETITLIILGFLLIGLVMFMIFVPVTQSWMIILVILAAIVVLAMLFSLIGFIEPGVFFPVLGGGGGMLIGILQYLFYLGII